MANPLSFLSLLFVFFAVLATGHSSPAPPDVDATLDHPVGALHAGAEDFSLRLLERDDLVRSLGDPDKPATHALRKRGSVGEAPHCPTYPSKFMTQKLDHTGKNKTKWQQQYQLVTKFYKPGGPIFFFQGEESYKMTCLEETIILQWAKEAGGIAAVLEHRHFGLSAPLGMNDSYTPKGLSWLTFENILGDAKEFIAQVKHNVTGAKEARVVAASGSYGGFLVTLFRQNAPELVDVAVASCSGLRSFGVDNNPYRYGWQEWVSRVWEQASPEAASHIRDAFTAFHQRVVANQTETLKADLGLCDAFVSAQAPTYYQLLGYTFLFPTELNYPYASEGRNSLAQPLNKMIDNVNKNWDPKHPVHVIREATKLWYSPLGYDCIDPLTVGVAGAPLIQSYPWNYVACSLFPLSTQDMKAATTIFVDNEPFELNFPTFCRTAYNVSVPTQDELWAKYHFGPKDLEESTGIIFSQGGYDPSAAVSVPQDFRFPRPLSYDSVRMFVTNMAHREDMFAPNPADRQEVRKLRQQELATILAWLDRLEGKPVKDQTDVQS